MSWDSYLDNLVAQSKDASGTAHVDKCCIIGLDGGAPWTTAASAVAFKVIASTVCLMCVTFLTTISNYYYCVSFIKAAGTSVIIISLFFLTA